MGDNPRQTVRWMQQQLMEAEAPQQFSSEDDDLMQRVDMLIEDMESEHEEYWEGEPPIRNFANNYGRQSKAERIQQSQVPKFDPNAAVLTKTKKQLRQKAKLRKKAEKKANINRNIKDLVFLAILEILGILAILGWWLQ